MCLDRRVKPRRNSTSLISAYTPRDLGSQRRPACLFGVLDPPECALEAFGICYESLPRAYPLSNSLYSDCSLVPVSKEGKEKGVICNRLVVLSRWTSDRVMTTS